MTAFYAFRSPVAPAAECVAFHHAGASSLALHSFLDKLPLDIHITCFEQSGRGYRFGEELQNLSMEDLAFDFLTSPDRPRKKIPTFFFGHSFGAHVSWRLAEQLTRLKKAPTGLILSASLPPQSFECGAIKRALASDEALVRFLEDLGQTPPDTLSQPDTRQILLRQMRQDLEWLLALVALPPLSPLPCRITALTGGCDDRAPLRGLEGWAEGSQWPLHLRGLEGGHFAALTDPLTVTWVGRTLKAAVSARDFQMLHEV